jgi:hypothetical protein
MALGLGILVWVVAVGVAGHEGGKTKNAASVATSGANDTASPAWQDGYSAGEQLYETGAGPTRDTCQGLAQMSAINGQPMGPDGTPGDVSTQQDVNDAAAGCVQAGVDHGLSP